MRNKTIFRMALIFCMALSGMVLTGCGKTTVNLNKYIEIDVSGYDTVGTARAEYDYDALRDDLKGKIKVNTKAMDKSTAELYKAFSSEDLVDLMLMGCVSGSLDQSTGLSNGDKVTWTWKCEDEDAEKYFNCKLKHSDITVDVKDLKEVPLFDPFEHITVTYSGTDGRGSLTIEKDSSADGMSYLTFTPSENSSLSNGDSVTVSVKLGTSEASFAEQFGKLPSPMEKTYTVEGLPAYITASSQITGDALDKMKKQTEDAIVGTTSGWDSSTLDSYDYIGNYFISAKDSSAYIKNEVYVVYRLHATSTLTNGKTKKDEEWEQDYYYYLGFKDLMLMPDGTLYVDINSYDKPGSFRSDTGIPSSSWFSFNHTLTYSGCENLDEIYKTAIVSHIEHYNYEENITE